VSSEQVADNATVMVDESVVIREEKADFSLGAESRFSRYVDHPVLINHLVWDGTTASSVLTVDVLDSYRLQAPASIKAKYSNLGYFTADLKIKVVVQGTAQAFGQMVLAFYPYMIDTNPAREAVILDRYDVFGVVNSKIVPHIVIDPSKTMTYELVLKCPTPSGYYSFSPYYSQGSYQLSRWIINPMGSGTATAATANVCVYMSLDNVSLDGLTNRVVMTSNPFVEEKGKLGSLADGAADFASKVGGAVPVLSPFTTLFSGVASGVGKILNTLGYSKPPSVGTQIVSLQRTFDAYSQVDGTYQGLVLGPSQSNGAAISPEYGLGSVDEMELSHIAAIPGLIVRDSTVTNAQAAGSLVSQWAVNPMASYFTTGPERFEPSPVAGLAAMHAAWRGDLVYTFEFVASVFHRATLLIAYDPYPGAVAPTLAEALTNLENTTVNVSGNAVVSVSVPFKQPFPAMRIQGTFAGPGMADGPNSNGRLYLYVINPVKSNGSADPLRYNIYMSSPNIKYFLPNPHRFTGLRITMTSNLFVVDEERVSFGKTNGMELSGYLCYPDAPTSVKQIASRTLDWTESTFPIAFGVNAFHFNLPQLVEANQNITYPSWIGSAYLGVRGSFNWTVSTYPFTNVGKPRARVSHHVHHASTIPYGVSTGAPPVTVENSYAWGQPNLEVASRVDVNAPIEIGWRFVPFRQRYSTYHDTVLTDFVYPFNTGGEVDVAVAGGDNLSFCWFLGFPKVNY